MFVLDIAMCSMFWLLWHLNNTPLNYLYICKSMKVFGLLIKISLADYCVKEFIIIINQMINCLIKFWMKTNEFQ